MTREELLLCGYDMIYLAACALHGNLPDKDLLSDMDLKGVYSLASKHSMQAITCMAVEKYLDSISVDPELQRKWKEAKAKAIRKNVLFDLEREKITSFMNEKGIWFMPLKGSVIQNYYPSYGMRQMSDNDILFDSNYRAELRDYMISQGYECEVYGISSHDVYKKLPVYNFEMHTELFNDYVNPKFHKYFLNIKDKLSLYKENEYRMTDEDLYIYSLMHMYKHFSDGGIGVRALMDVYVLNNRFRDSLNRSYIEKELKQLDAIEFENEIRILSEKLFGNDYEINRKDRTVYTEREIEIIEYCISSETHGILSFRVKNKLKEKADSEDFSKSTKIKYLFNRIFPPAKHYEKRYPVAYKYRILLPFAWLHRAVKGFIKRHSVLWKEFLILIKLKNK